MHQDIDIKKIIHEELSILVDIFYYMESLKDKILKSEKIEKLNRDISQISKLALQLSKVEKERILLFDNFAKEKGIKDSLDDFIEYFKEDNEMTDILLDLKDKLVDVSTISEVLKELLKAKMEYNDILIKLFMEPAKPAPTYNKNGIYKNVGQSNKINWQG
ncbi:FlgN protein [Marinitoga piezophila KA3]|uniref:FlgN protein n=1 Tax=Marinitoga piezophila (strain DSM 14283 / JCM 11233 / KA3) TaxID=443254 RepID=H2J5V6_MARPK|nr:flagellar export chaperone FlgN [Marinitoga piezophila]AEX86175.1 FlgN protein [Marinitoga piezophila KA3]